MKVTVPLENDGKLADRFGKHAPAEYTTDGYPTRSFPVAIEGAPEGTVTFALAFLDWDAIPVGGFCWIHWVACDIPGKTSEIPEDASASGSLAMVQGANSNGSPLLGEHVGTEITWRYAGPQPPDKDHLYTLEVYALDTRLGLREGFYLNELYRAMDGHILDRATFEIPSRV